MSAITYVASDSNPANVGMGDALLGPLRFCGKQWREIAEPLQDGDILWKAAQIAWKVILSFGMSLVTPIAFIPALAGIIYKSFNTHTDAIECDVDLVTKNALVRLGFQDPSIRDSQICQQIIQNINTPENSAPNVISDYLVAREGQVQNTIFLIRFPFLSFAGFITDCFNEQASITENDRKEALLRLSDRALGIVRPGVNDSRPEDRILQNCSRAYLTYSLDNTKMRVEARY